MPFAISRVLMSSYSPRQSQISSVFLEFDQVARISNAFQKKKNHSHSLPAATFESSERDHIFRHATHEREKVTRRETAEHFARIKS